MGITRHGSATPILPQTTRLHSSNLCNSVYSCSSKAQDQARCINRATEDMREDMEEHSSHLPQGSKHVPGRRPRRNRVREAQKHKQQRLLEVLVHTFSDTLSDSSAQ